MTSGRRTAVLVSIAAGALAVLAFTVGQLNDDAILRASTAGLLAVCFSSAFRAIRQRPAAVVHDSGAARARAGDDRSRH